METKKDTLEIARVLENEYFKSIYTGDVVQLRKVYYAGTLLFGDVNN